MLLGRPSAEQAGLPALAILRGAITGFDRAIEREQQLRARAGQRIHRAGSHQAFNHAAVDGSHVRVFAELVDRA